MRGSFLCAVAAALATLSVAPLSVAQETEAQCPAIGVGVAGAPAARARSRTSEETLAAANGAARQRPEARSFAQARQIYTYASGAIYELHANPNFITAILLEPGEALSDIAAGDTARWMVTEAEGESETDARTIVLVKPQAPNLRTNIMLVTSRRTYVIEAVAQAGQAYAAEIAWCYPERVASNANVSDLNFGYRVRTKRGRAPAWLPTRVFDDGRRTWIEMAPHTAAQELPPLFVVTGEGVELVNYRVQGDRYMVDRVFDVAELRLGTRKPVVVRIERALQDSTRRTRGR